MIIDFKFNSGSMFKLNISDSTCSCSYYFNSLDFKKFKLFENKYDKINDIYLYCENILFVFNGTEYRSDVFQSSNDSEKMYSIYVCRGDYYYKDLMRDGYVEVTEDIEDYITRKFIMKELV